jgi:hypothetical protein
MPKHSLRGKHGRFVAGPRARSRWDAIDVLTALALIGTLLVGFLQVKGVKLLPH